MRRDDIALVAVDTAERGEECEEGAAFTTQNDVAKEFRAPTAGYLLGRVAHQEPWPKRAQSSGSSTASLSVVEEDHERAEDYENAIAVQSNFRSRYLDTLSRKGAWLPSPQRPPPHQTVIIFDWDDTLLCTTWLNAKSSRSWFGAKRWRPDAATAERLALIERCAIELLGQARMLARTWHPHVRRWRDAVRVCLGSLQCASVAMVRSLSRAGEGFWGLLSLGRLLWRTRFRGVVHVKAGGVGLAWGGARSRVALSPVALDPARRENGRSCHGVGRVGQKEELAARTPLGAGLCAAWADDGRANINIPVANAPLRADERRSPKAPGPPRSR